MSALTSLLFLSAAALAHTEVSFSPGGNCEKMTVDLINEAASTVDAAVYSINNVAIVEAYERAQKRGVSVRILTDHVEAGGNSKITLRLAGDKFKGFKLHSVSRIMHNKFVIVDSDHLITGSFNETEPAQNSNSENCIVTDESEIVDQYDEQFKNVLWENNTQEKSDIHLSKIRSKALAKKPAKK
jgi:phosphatidylserine/phosphatidylglycerophosphate/cardiolipin synthase-like enzyme